MPIMQVYYPQPSLDKSRKLNLAQKLTDILIKMEGGAGTYAGRAFSSVLLTEVDPDNWFVGGVTDGTFVAQAGKFLVYVTIPEGYMNAAQKSDVHAWVNAAFLEVTGHTADPTAGANVLVVINEVPEGNWGANGKTIGLDSIAESVGLSRQSERFQWVEKYFAAKQRALTAAGYPQDMGGVIPSAIRSIP